MQTTTKVEIVIADVRRGFLTEAFIGKASFNEVPHVELLDVFSGHENNYSCFVPS
jgi:hypothetical protein